MLVETDAPYLSPEPMRKQKMNEPSLVFTRRGDRAGEGRERGDRPDHISERGGVLRVAVKPNWQRNRDKR